MRLGKLYIKIFLSFLVILVITEVLIFGVFMVFVGKTYKDRFEELTRAKDIQTFIFFRVRKWRGNKKMYMRIYNGKGQVIHGSS